MHVNKIIESDYHEVSIKHFIVTFIYKSFFAAMYALNPWFEIKSNPN